MEKAEKWIFLMLGSVIGMFICTTLFKFFVTGDEVTILGKGIAVIFGLLVGLWICSFIEFIIVMVRNKRIRRGLK